MSPSNSTSPNKQSTPSSPSTSNAAPYSPGPLSPTDSGRSSFIFPIRSVFQGMGQMNDPNQPNQTLTKADGNQLQRTQSRSSTNAAASGSKPLQSAAPAAASSNRDRRASLAQSRMRSTENVNNNDVGIETIEQMLQRSAKSETLKHGTSYSKDDGHNGFFSLPLPDTDGSENPMFSPGAVAAARRSSEGKENTKTDYDISPGETVGRTTNAEKGQDSQEKSRETTPAVINYRHVPGPVADPTAKPAMPVVETRDGNIKQPKPRSANKADKLDLLANSTDPDEKNDVQAPAHAATYLEGDSAPGEGGLIRPIDIGGIVRLSQAGSLGSGASSCKSRNSKASASLSAALKNVPISESYAQNKANVQNYLAGQANTINHPDPNAPTPSPAQNADMDEEEAERYTPEGEADWGTSDTSLSVRDSSDAATGSCAANSDNLDVEDVTEGSVDEPFVTFRFEHVSTEDGHHVVVGREGQLQKCEDEPITTPGAVQGFGVMIVLEEDYETGNLNVRQVSENSTDLLGLSPRYLFRLDCFSRILPHSQEDLLRDNIEFLPEAGPGKAGVDDEGPQVFLLSGYGEPGSDLSEDEPTPETAHRRREWTCWCAVHRPSQPSWDKKDADGKPILPPDHIILELELENDPFNPLYPPFPSSSEVSGRSTPLSDSGTGTTLSAGSMPDKLSSTAGSGSMGSTTTMGSTPRPYGNTSDISTVAGQSQKWSASSKLSKRSDSVESSALGLEGTEIDYKMSDILESTTNHAKPLRALERMRRGAGEGGAPQKKGGRRQRPSQRKPSAGSTGTMDVFAIMQQISEQLGSAQDLQAFLKIVIGVVQDLCRFHRVLIYQFNENFDGEVVSELVEWGKTTDLFKGLTFPAADIPVQARELYKINKVRLLYDRGQTTARMVLRSKEDLEYPIDMTHSFLRAMSPIHIKYLANMGVRSSMSISVMAFGELWGLIACHSYGNTGMRVSFPVRQLLRLLSDSISRNIERLSYASRLHTRKLISTIPTDAHPTGYIVSNADDLLELFDSDAGLLVIGDGCKLLGQTEHGQAMLQLAEYLRLRRFDMMQASHNVSKDYPDLGFTAGSNAIAGMLYIPLSANGRDFIVLLRKGQEKEVHWAGKPYKSEEASRTAVLEPRRSFKSWTEKIHGTSRAWTDEQMETAGVLALVYGKFVLVWREKEQARKNNHLTSILLTNASHELRTPLHQVISYLEIAMSGQLDPETREHLAKSHVASKSLLFNINDLLSLTRIESGNETTFNDPFDLRQCVDDATSIYKTEAVRRGIDFAVDVDPELPTVVGDSQKIRTVISNLVANSVKFTESGSITVTCRVGDKGQSESNHVSNPSEAGVCPIEIIVSDTGCGIPSEKLAAIFVLLEQAEFSSPDKGASGLGLGLAVVARIVETLGGQLRAESEVGSGTRFYFTVVMQATTEGANSSVSHSQIATRQNTQSSESGSMESALSRRSARSEIDNFVEEFATSHMVRSSPSRSSTDDRVSAAEARMSAPGTFPVTDSSWPVRSAKVDGDNDREVTYGPPTNPPAKSPDLDPWTQVKRSPVGADGPSRRASVTSDFKREERGKASGQHGSAPSHSAGNRPRRLRVLVVEDDAINSQILQRRLRMDKHHCVAVQNGQEAVDRIRDDEVGFDVVLMDIQMPVMDGRQSAKEIRRLEATTGIKQGRTIRGHIPIIAVSASLYESDRFEMAEAFDGWLLKPLAFDRVRDLFAGLEDEEIQACNVYVPGKWERGGFLIDLERTK